HLATWPMARNRNARAFQGGSGASHGNTSLLETCQEIDPIGPRLTRDGNAWLKTDSRLSMNRAVKYLLAAGGYTMLRARTERPARLAGKACLRRPLDLHETNRAITPAPPRSVESARERAPRPIHNARGMFTCVRLHFHARRTPSLKTRRAHCNHRRLRTVRPCG